VIGSGIFLFMPIITAPRFHPTLVLVPSVFMVAYLIAMVFYLRALGPVTTAVRTSFGQMNSGLTAAIEGIETVKGAAREESEIERFLHGAGAVRHASIEQGKVEAQFLPLLLIGLAEGAAFWHALALFQQGLLTTGDVVAYMGLIALFGFPVFTSLFAYSQVASGVSSARRILELVNAQVDLDENEQGHAEAMKGSVRFEGVTFHYRSDETGLARPALQDVSFSIEAGQTLALVGQTGSGKSTVAKLMNRIYDINGGRVLVDGIDVRNWRLATLRQQISIIEQDIFLFSRSIAENIAFGNGAATQEEIEAAARAAQAHDFILSFPEGYRTVIGERGVTLSGGQRQRLALARAFLTNPAILILDDSTSAIDSATEDQIQRAIEAASAGRTTILITHRLSQIRWADKIVVLRKGRVVAAGTHDELMASSQAYRDIFARI
jgi:ATP-binding cassette subfamily B protein